MLLHIVDGMAEGPLKMDQNVDDAVAVLDDGMVVEARAGGRVVEGALVAADVIGHDEADGLCLAATVSLLILSMLCMNWSMSASSSSFPNVDEDRTT